MSSDFSSDPFPDDDEASPPPSPSPNSNQKKPKILIDVETGILKEKAITCEFCKHQLLETESEIVLDCGHVLCENCFNFFKSQKRQACPICFKSVSNFK